MNWNDLKFVLAVHQARSFQAAGRLLGMTHTTVGRRIAALEADIGAPLFLRERQRCVPTAICARLVVAAARIEDEVARASHDAGLGTTSSAGRVRVVGLHWILNEVLLPAMPALSAAHPGLHLRLMGGLAEAGPGDARWGEADPTISFRFDLEPGRAEEVIPVARIGYAVYAAVGAGRPETLPWVSFGNSFPFEWLKGRGVAPDDIVLTATDASAIQLALRHGVGRGLIPVCLGERDASLRRLSGPAPELTRTLRAVGLWQDLASDPCRAVLDWAEQRFRELGCGIEPDAASGAGNGVAGPAAGAAVRPPVPRPA